jgi:hypothetical protein
MLSRLEQLHSRDVLILKVLLNELLKEEVIDSILHY